MSQTILVPGDTSGSVSKQKLFALLTALEKTCRKVPSIPTPASGRQASIKFFATHTLEFDNGDRVVMKPVFTSPVFRVTRKGDYLYFSKETT